MNKFRTGLLLILSLPAYLYASAEKPPLKIGIVADVQYADAPHKGERHYRLSLDKLQEALNTFRGEQVDFILSLGDLFDHGYDAFQRMDSLLSSQKLPKVYHALGNHDILPDPGQRSKVYKRLGLQKQYYCFSKGNVRVIILDGNEISLHATAKGSPERLAAEQQLAELKSQNRPYAHPWNGAMSAKQLQWLDKQLGKADRRKEQVLVCSHFPIWPPTCNDQLWNSEQVLEILNAHPSVVAYLCGHNHPGGIHVHTDFVHYNFMGMVNSTQNRFAIVELTPQKLKIKGFGDEDDTTYDL